MAVPDLWTRTTRGGGVYVPRVGRSVAGRWQQGGAVGEWHSGGNHGGGGSGGSTPSHGGGGSGGSTPGCGCEPSRCSRGRCRSGGCRPNHRRVSSIDSTGIGAVSLDERCVERECYNFDATGSLLLEWGEHAFATRESMCKLKYTVREHLPASMQAELPALPTAAGPWGVTQMARFLEKVLCLCLHKDARPAARVEAMHIIICNGQIAYELDDFQRNPPL